MNYNSSNRITGQATGVDKAIAGLLVAGVTFVLGYTVVRASLAADTSAAATAASAIDNDVQVLIPHEGALWADVGTSF
ncbi:MAG: hypothetical protein AAFP03_14655 [Cyanobacteria bacterium J06598_3]